jgi:hypothetical protein
MEEKMKWYERNPQRFEAEINLIKQNHPGARIFIQRGKVTIYLKVTENKNRYLAEIVYPEDFPYKQPRACIIKPQLPNLHEKIHRFRDGSLCLARPEQMGPQTSGKVICDWVKGWVKAYEVWLRTGRFPNKYLGRLQCTG